MTQPALDTLITVGEIAKIVNYGPSTVSNWRKRHKDFPAPSESTPSGDLFVLGEVLTWLDTHDKAYELPQVSFPQQLTKILWSWADSLRDEHRPEVLLETFLQLVYLRLHPPVDDGGERDSDGWDRLVEQLIENPETTLRLQADRYEPPVSTALTPRWRGQHIPGTAFASVCQALGALTFDVKVGPAITQLIRPTDEILHGEHTTPAAVRQLLASVLAPLEGNLYDPACGTGLLLAELWRTAGGRGVRLFGQDINDSSWRLAVLHLALIDADFDLGDSPADIFHHDLHPHMRANRIALDPPLGLSLKSVDQLQGDPRWVFGLPPKRSAELGWAQHLVWHLDDKGLGAMLCTPSVLSSGGVERSIRQELVDAGVLEAVVQLPAGLLSRTHIPLVLLTFSKCSHPRDVLFVDAKKMGQRERGETLQLDAAEIEKIAATFRDWREGSFQAEPAFSTSATAEEIRSLDANLTPGLYVDYLGGEAEINGRPILEVVADLQSDFTVRAAAVRESLRYVEEMPIAAQGRAMKNWETVALGELLSGSPKTGVRQVEGDPEASVPFISTGLVSSGAPVLNHPPKELTAQNPKDRTVRRGDLLLVSRGVSFDKAVGCTKIEFDANATYSESLVRLRIEPMLADPDYVRLFLTSRLGSLALGAVATGSVITNLPYGSLSRVKIRMPDLEHQRQIVSTMREVERAEADLEALLETASKTRDALREALLHQRVQPSTDHSE